MHFHHCDAPVIKCGILKAKRPPKEDWKTRHFALHANGWLVNYPVRVHPTETRTTSVYLAKNCHVTVPSDPDNVFILQLYCEGATKIVHFKASCKHSRKEWVDAFLKHCVSTHLPKELDQVNFEDFDFWHTLSRGTFSTVQLCRNKATSNFYAARIYRKDSKRDVKKEKELLVKLDNPFISNLHYYVETTTRVYFVMDFVQGGSLADYLAKEKVFSEETARFYAAEIAMGIIYFHTKRVIHRNIRLENIMIDTSGHIKITDFTLCQQNAKTRDVYRGTNGPLAYMPPEMIQDEMYSYATDWWAFGIVLYKMLTGECPFNFEDYELRHGRLRIKPVTIPAAISDEGQLILSQLLSRNPENRLGCGPAGANQVILHSWFASIKWGDVVQKRLPVVYKPEVESPGDIQHYNVVFGPENQGRDYSICF